MIPSSLRNKYRFGLLHRNIDKIRELEQEILKVQGTQEDINREKEWAESCYSILDQGLILTEQGCGVNSPEIARLEKKAEQCGKIVREVFLEIIRNPDKTKGKNPTIQNILSEEKEERRKPIVVGHIPWIGVQTKRQIIKSGINIQSISIQRAIKNNNLEQKLKTDENNKIVSALPFIMDLNNTDSIQEQNIELKPHTNFLPLLKPSSKWTVLIDETGDNFTGDVFTNKVPEKSKGKIAAVLVPQYCNLPKINGYHSYYQDLEVIEQVVHKLLYHSCGILGITANSGHVKQGDLWYATIESLIDLILRFIPIEKKTQIEIFIEQREHYTLEFPRIVNNICTNCLNRLGHSNPKRANLLNVTSKFISKEDHPLIGYADAVAFCWNAPTATSLLLKSGWKDTCLLGSNPTKLCEAIDLLVRQEPLSIPEWETIISSPYSQLPGSLHNFLLKSCGEIVSQKVELWTLYLKYINNHFYLNDIGSKLLKQEFDWLNRWAPGESQMSSETRLLWHAVKMAKDNLWDNAQYLKLKQKSVEKYCRLIYPENAQLVCRTEIEMAYSYIYNYDFQSAYDTIQHWLTESEATSGRHNYANVFVTAGLLNAFIDNQEVAIQAFAKAEQAFAQLSNLVLAQTEHKRLAFYRLIALLDQGIDQEKITQKMISLFGMPLEVAASKLSNSSEPNSLRSHYVLLRYLAQTPEQIQLLSLYKNKKNWWSTGSQTPWDLIWFYRAVISTDYLEEAYTALEKAYTIAINNPTYRSQLRACVFLGGLYYYNRELETQLNTLINRMKILLPQMGVNRTSTLTQQLESPIEPFALAKRILPYIFR